ncbi:MAG: SDR family oxidoreductase, partial [Planctomycetes bacterium]|nr:SDR family oxidoreductase [Planctomycetota bacterium]
QEEFGGLDILVNNAGLFPRASFDDTTLELWDELFAVNVRGAFLCSQAAAPLMRQRGGGSIINIGSCHAFATGGNLFAYGCTKGALYVLTMNMARCLAKDRIRVNWITVGWVLTEKELEVQAKEGRDLEWLKQNEAQRPMGRYNTAEEIAAGCVYLASDDAQNVTAANLNVSGGMSIRV